MKMEPHPGSLDMLIDGEGVPAELLAIEAHLAGCPACRTELAAKRRLSASIRNYATRYEPSAAMREKWQNIAAPAEASPNVVVPFRRVPRQWLAMAASIALVAVFSAGGMHLVDSGSDRVEQLADEIVSSHIRSLAGTHLYDVQSTDQHTVKPWFAGKISFSPPVRDLAEQGFPLLGGRLDYIDRQPVAALIYRHSQHIVNVFIWPASDRPCSVATGPTRQGYNTLHWTRDGMNFWAVSDINQPDLQSFADHFRD